MGTTVLEEKYPFLTNYFKRGIESQDHNIAHCILFYGSDLEAQYELALEIARLLNCTGDKSNECNCLNCKWIRSNQHPAVLTVSKVDNKESDDTTKTVISVEQARNIKNKLLISSEYHRVLIFCDKDDNGNICGLNNFNFQEEAANTLLKTFEEPPKGVTFFFLTKNKEDLLTTVISRAQCFFVPSRKDDVRDYSLVQNLMENYPDIPRNDVLNFYDEIIALTKDNEPMEILNQIQNYMCEMLKSNSGNSLLRIRLIKDINAVEKAKRETTLGMNISVIAENLAYEVLLND